MNALLRNRSFQWLAIGQFLSLMGDGMYFAVLTFLVLSVEKTGGPMKAGIVAFVETVPFLVFSPVAGALADRFRRKLVLLCSDALSGALLLAFVAVVRPEQAGVLNIGILAFLLSTLATAFGPARDALIPMLFPDEIARARANAVLQTLTQAAWLSGTSVAAAVLGALGWLFPRWSDPQKMFLLLAINGLSFWASFACIAAMGRVEEHATALRAGFLRDAVSGYLWVLRDPTLPAIFILTAADNFFIMGPALVGSNLFVKNTLGGTAAQYGAFLSALFAGWFVGGLVLAGAAHRFRPLRWLLFGIVMDGATYIPFFWIRDFRVALAAIALHGFFIPFITVMRTTYLQAATPEEHRGKVFSLVGMTVTGFTALSALATGAAGEIVSPPALYLIAGTGGAVCGILGFLFFRTGRTGSLG
jgi:MFS family permease